MAQKITDSKAAAKPGVDADRALGEVQCRDLFRDIREGFFVGEIVRDGKGQPGDFVFLEVNEAFTRQTGVSADAAVDRRVTDVTPGIQSEIIDTYGRVVDTGQSAAFETEIPALAHRSYEARAHSLGGERFAVLFLEITERKRIEKALAESRAMLSEIVNSVDQIVWSTRPDGYHDFFNSRWYDFTGEPSSSAEEEAWAGLLHADDRERVSKRWRHSLATGEPYEIEFPLRHRSGQYRWILARPSGSQRGWRNHSLDGYLHRHRRCEAS